MTLYGARSRHKFAHITAPRLIALVVFIVVPLLLILVGGVLLLPPQYQVPALRSVFLLTVCLLPETMYYLFIAACKYSLLNELLTNLDRLGLLIHRPLPPQTRVNGHNRESEPARRRRVQTYPQKFEAIYGELSPDVVDQLLTTTDPTGASSAIDRKRDGKASTSLVSVFSRGNAIPVILATVFIILGWLIALPPRLSTLGAAEGGMEHASAVAKLWLSALSPEPTPVNFSFLGAYFFSPQMLFRRYVRRDLRTSAYMAVSLRNVLAIIGTGVVVAAARLSSLHIPEVGLLVFGFAIGVFPRVAWQVVQAATKKLTRAATVLPSLTTQLALSDLDGMTVWHEARLEEEDIEDIPNMATADVVDLMLYTRLCPDRSIDWVDQAILYTHLGPGPEDDPANNALRRPLRAHGIRTATSLIEAYRRSAERGDRPAFEALLPGEGRKPICSLVDALETNPNLELISTWRGLKGMERTLPTERAPGDRQTPKSNGEEGESRRDPTLVPPTREVEMFRDASCA